MVWLRKTLLAFQESVVHALPNVNGNRDNKRLHSTNYEAPALVLSHRLDNQTVASAVNTHTDTDTYRHNFHFC